MSLPAPETVVERASDASTDGDVNVVVAGDVDTDSVERTDDGYVGETAGAVGRLAAGSAAGGTLHYPSPDFTAAGPWIVLAPLAGFVSTVATGVGEATVVAERETTSQPGRESITDQLSALLEAAQPTHEHYPVETDEQGVFTTGMTTFELSSLVVEDELRATFRVSTTPATRPSDVTDRFADVPGVERVDYETVVGVTRADPSAALREAVEAAHREVRGDCEYEWLPDPGVFATIPGGEKLALGTGTPRAGAFSRAQYQTCVELLETTLSNVDPRSEVGSPSNAGSDT